MDTKSKYDYQKSTFGYSVSFPKLDKYSLKAGFCRSSLRDWMSVRSFIISFNVCEWSTFFVGYEWWKGYLTVLIVDSPWMCFSE